MSQSDFATVDETNFKAEVLDRGGLVLLDFWSNGCVPCKQLTRVLTELAPSLPDDVRIATVEVSANSDLAARFNVRSVPTLVFIKDGAAVETRTGVDRRQVLKKLVDAHA